MNQAQITATCPTVLVVDDDQVSTMMFELVLSSEGYSVYTAANVAAALNIGQRVPIDLLLSDFALPDGDGCKLLEQLRQVAPLTGVIISGYSDDKHLALFREAGFAEHLTKPVAPDRVVATLKKLLQK